MMNTDMHPIAWKGPIIREMGTRMLKNQNSMLATNPHYNLKLPLPMKLYRKETPFTQLANPQLVNTGTFRARASIDDFERPGGHHVITAADDGLPCTTNNPVNVLNPKPNFVSGQVSNRTQASNALRRVRSSSGVMSNRYSSSTKQYLDNRKMSFAENQFQYFRAGNATQIPGGPLTKNNIYAAQGLNTASFQKYYVAGPAPIAFQYTDGNGNTFTASIPAHNSYDIGDINSILQASLNQNGVCTVDRILGTSIGPLQFSYDNLNQRIVLTSYFYYKATSPTTVGPGQFPQLVVDPTNTAFQQLVGFPSGSFPSTAAIAAATTTTTTSPLSVSSSLPFVVGTVNFKPVYYKPTNFQFAQDGAVAASDRILRLKYNTITNNGKLFLNAYGKQVASALSYSVSDSIYYTIKDQIGFPLTRSPDIDAITGIMKCCPSTATTL